MRFKRVFEFVPLPAKLQLLWIRITFARIALIYFIFSVVHCVVQTIVQVQAYSTNARAAEFLYQLIIQGDAYNLGFAVLGNDLRFCEAVPSSMSAEPCQLIWRGAPSANPQDQADLQAGGTFSSTPPENTISPTPTTTSLTISTPAVSPTTAPALDVVDDDDDDEDGLDSVSDSDSDSDIGDVDDLDEPEDEPAVTGTTTALPIVSPVVSPLVQPLKRNIIITAIDTNGSTEVMIDGFGWNNEMITLSQTCLVSLNWPLQKLDNTKREDIVFIMFQLWVLGMSTAALLNESMPHIIATLLTHVLATAWGGFQIQHTAVFHKEFIRLTTNGACGVNLLPTYWKDRAAAEIPSLVLNAVALILSAFLSWRLIKLFGWQTFKRVGASRTIARVYKLVLSLSIAIQLSTFFIVVSIGLWIDQLYNGAIGSLAREPKLYKGVLITVLVLLLPWLYIGWIGVRREKRILAAIFLVMATAYLGGWGAMFASITFRWTFILWRFFSLMASASVLLTLITLLLGILCRINFGKGLSRYLNAHEPIPEEPAAGMQQDLEAEKIEYPSFGPVPTYSATFERGCGFDVPRVPPVAANNPRLGPRFSDTSLEPFDPQPSETGYPSSEYAWERSTVISSTQLSRQPSGGSQRSHGSDTSYDSAPPYSGRHANYGVYDRQKRWVIE